MIPMLQAKGLPGGAAAGIAALIGPMQVMSRVVDLTVHSRLPIIPLGFLAVGLVPVALCIWIAADAQYWALGLFALVYGLGQGFLTVARGSLPAELFGREHYGAVSGALAAPALISLALGPFLASALWTAMGGSYAAVAMSLLTVSLTGLALYAMAVRRRGPA
jgi:hypothetical protein